MPPRPKTSIAAWIVGVAALVGVAAILVASIVAAGNRATTGKPSATASTQAAETSTPETRAPETSAAESATAAPTRKVVVADDQSSQVTVPNGWKTYELNPIGKIELVDPTVTQYLLVLSQPREDFEVDLQGFADLSIKELSAAAEVTDLATPKNLSINGAPALEYEFSLTLNGLRFAYWLTVIEGPTNYHRVMTWTFASDADRYRPALRRITQSFKGI
ncbi:hypothetical protein Acor_76820 [Acrocarpospora corrugata]|uniref:PsbP C-terminal domain-containing protein n=1 Tax=Acrocarpospora corrugata TaxID=35763 RepID=A0A5M3W9R3_9ACTN|nr:hypothetical protein [Acrocarpospora corrugata]GES05614.1 hypothetical protein Acor_76820 [Acrocarpospora corrugata]